MKLRVPTHALRALSINLLIVAGQGLCGVLIGLAYAALDERVLSVPPEAIGVALNVIILTGVFAGVLFARMYFSSQSIATLLALGLGSVLALIGFYGGLELATQLGL